MNFKSYLSSALAFLFMAMSIVGCKEDEPDVPVNPLTFELAVANVTDHGADLTVTPSESDRTYFSDLFLASEFAGKSDEEIIEAIAGKISDSNLKTGVSEVSGEKMELEAETEYLLLAVGYEEGQIAEKLAKKSFTTLAKKVEPEPEPEPDPMTFELSTGKITAHEAEVKVVPSDNERTYFSSLLFAADFVDSSDEEIIESILYFLGEDDLLKGEYTETFTELDPETEYVLFALGYENDKPTSELVQLPFTTPKEEVPELDPMTFVIETSNVTRNSVDLKITPSDENKTYHSVVMPSSRLSRLTDNQIIDLIMLEVKDEELMTGIQEFTVGQLDRKTDYTALAVGFADGKANTALAKAEFTTLNKIDMTFDLEVVSVKATEAELKVVPSKADETYFAHAMPYVYFDGLSDERIVEAVTGLITSSKIRTGEQVFTLTDLTPETEYLYFAFGYDDNEATTDVAKIKFTTPEKEKPQQEFELSLEALFNNFDKKIEFKARCTSQDAALAGYMLMPTADLEQLLADGQTIEDLTYEYSNLTAIPYDQLADLNAGGVKIQVDDQTAGAQWTILFDIRNYDAMRVVKRADAVYPDDVEPDPETAPELELVGGAGDVNGNSRESACWVRIGCPSRDLDNASYLNMSRKDFNDKINSGMTVEEIVEQSRNQMYVMSRGDVKEIKNTGSIGIVLDNLAADSQYTFIAELSNEFGSTVGTVEIQTEANAEEKTFELEVSDITDCSAILKVIPSDPDITYYAGCALAARYEGLAESMVILNLMSGKTADDLLQGTHILEQTGLYKGLKYMVYAFGVKDGKAVTGLRKEYFITENL